MPARPTSRLDVALVCRRPATDAHDWLLRYTRRLQDLDVLGEGREVGPAASSLLVEGFTGWRVESGPDLKFYANKLGGFKVQCAECGSPAAAPFSKAVANWRQGGPFEMTCGDCGAVAPLDQVRTAPPSAFGYAALILVGAEGWTPGPLLESELSDLRVVGIRR